MPAPSMNEETNNRTGELLQEIVDNCNSLQVYLEIIATDCVSVQKWIELFKLETLFDGNTGVLQDIIRKPPADKDEAIFRVLNSDEFDPVVEDHILFSKETIQRLAALLEKLQENRGSLLRRISKLPHDVHELLSDICRKQWRPYLTRYCILPLEYWPMLTSRTGWIPNSGGVKRPAFPTRVDWLFEYFSDTDPTEDWKRICGILDSCVDDILVASLELRTKVKRHSDGPCGINQWCYEDRISKDRMTNKQFSLASYLWERLGRKVAFGDLIGKDRLFENVHDNTLQKHSSDISKFFVNESIPLVVATEDKKIWMESWRFSKKAD